MKEHRAKMVLLVLALAGIADTGILLAVAGGVNLGTLLPGAVGFGLLLWLGLRAHVTPLLAPLHVWWIKLPVLGGGALLLLSFLVAQGCILYHAPGMGRPEARWCILLGAGVRGDRPSLTLRRRIEIAAQYLKQFPHMRIVVSGGKGPGKTVSEAEVMRNELVKDGIEASRIFMEERATSTFENLRYSREIILASGTSDDAPISVISSDFHLFRTRLIAGRLGLRVLPVRAPTPWYLLPNVCIREYFALVKSILIDRE